MKIIDDLIYGLKQDSIVREIHTCVFWTAVTSKYCGLASTFQDEHPHHQTVRDAGDLVGKPALELVEYVNSENLLEASIGMATINSLIEIDETRCVVENAIDILMEKGEGKNVAVIGHFPWIPRLRQVAGKLWVLEQNPQPGDLPAESAEEVLPKADVVAITGTSFINHTVEKLLDLSKGSFIVMVGPTSPLSPVLFDWGVNVISGTKVVDPEKVIRCISQGAIFRQVEGVKLLNMVR